MNCEKFDSPARFISACSARFPNVSQRTFRAEDWIIIRHRQRSNVTIRFRPFAWQSAKQIPFASVGISSYNPKIVAGTDVLVRDSGWDDNHIASARLDILAVLATDSQVCNAGINAQHFMRRAVVMGGRDRRRFATS